jgi:ribosome-binding protein aMBF1 (putative translation factor)
MTARKHEVVMKPSKRKRLEAAGFKVGTVQEFLGLCDDEMALIDLKVRLVATLKAAREAKGITQQKLAGLMASSQSRVAKLEGACANASLDLICRALFAVGVTTREIGKVIASKRAA